MQEVIDFIIKYWHLSGLLTVIVIAYVIFELRQLEVAKSIISPTNLVELINHQQAVVLDIRSKNEYINSHIVGSINIPVDELSSRYNQISKSQGKPVVIISNSTKNYEDCENFLISKKFTRILTLSGGIQSWEDEGFPLISK